IGDNTVCDCVDRSTISAAKVHAAVHAVVAQYWMTAHTIAGCLAASCRTDQLAAGLPHARCLKPVAAPAAGPFEHLRFHFAIALYASEKQVAHFHFTRFSAA